jgi:hypothetical protein
MNTMTLPQTPTLDLLEIIDFKWLMAHEGHRVHVERLQADPVYARECLAIGAASAHKALQMVALRMCARLGITPHSGG